MNCKFCGQELHENSVFCPECGKSVNESVAETQTETNQQTEEQTIEIQTPVEPVYTQKKYKPVFKFDFKYVTLVIGTLIMFIGFIRLSDSSVSITSTSFGADFYTYTYKGIVECAEILGKINATLSWCLIAIGAIIVLKAIKEFWKK
jgi:hypothetical protein